jgi:hypothetical protein
VPCEREGALFPAAATAPDATGNASNDSAILAKLDKLEDLILNLRGSLSSGSSATQPTPQTETHLTALNALSGTLVASNGSDSAEAVHHSDTKRLEAVGTKENLLVSRTPCRYVI